MLHFGSIGAAAHEALDGKDGTVGVGDSLTLGSLAHEAFLIGESDDGGSSAATVGVGDALGLLAFHNIDAAIGGAKVDADDLTHNISPCGYYVIEQRGRMVSEGCASFQDNR